MPSILQREPLLSRLPKAWRAALSHARIEPVEGGMSAASVFRVGGSHYLKIAQGVGAHDLRQEIERTAWLAQRGVLVARAVRVHDGGDLVAVLSETLEGASADETRLSPQIDVPALARALAALHAVPAADCPFDESIAMRLRRAGALIARDEVDPRAFAPRNRDVSPAALLDRLSRGRPDESVVVAHGDATLSNLIIGDDLSVGFIDCGHAGRADRYLDIALVVEGLAERFGSASADGFMAAYGAPEFDRRRASYFLDLYELF